MRTSSTRAASRRSLQQLVEHEISGLIVPDLPLEEAPSLRDALRRAAASRSCRSSRRRRRTERLERIGEQARGFLYAVSVTGTTGERGALDLRLVWMLKRVAGRASVPVAIGFGIGTPEQAAAAAEAGAAGVIVGSRLVRAAAEAEDPAAAVRGGRRELRRGTRARALRRGSSARIPRRWLSRSPTTFAFCLWVVLWAVGIKSFDGILVAIVIVLVGATLEDRPRAICPTPTVGASTEERLARSPGSGDRPS